MNKRVDVLMQTSYLDACCNVLESTRRAPSDLLLVQLVRVQQIAQAIAQTFTTDPSQQQQATPMPPLMAVVQSFESRLDSLRQALPPELSENGKASLSLPFFSLSLSFFSQLELAGVQY